MIYSDWQDFWWSDITGAHEFINHVANALLADRNVILQEPSDIPWRQAMRSAVKDEYSSRINEEEIIIRDFDIQDDNPSGMQPGRFILEKLALSEEIRTGYRERNKISIQTYIKKYDLLKNHIIWVKGLDKKATTEWIQFCNEFSSKSVQEGLFVIETKNNIRSYDSKIFEHINYNECVSNYDLQVFNSFILDNERKYNDSWKNYIATLAASICGIDAEISELFLKSIDFYTESPITGLQRIAENNEYARRGAEETSNHILWYVRTGNISEINRRIWAAQVQVLFPIIEMERIEIIEKYEDKIRDGLERKYVTQYGVQVIDPIDVELGTLCHMMTERVNGNQYLLYIPDEEDRERIKFLHKCRNVLAHVNCCSPERVTCLIEKCLPEV